MTARPALKHSRKGWAGRLSALPVFIASIAVLATPSRADPGLQTMTYEVYAGGLHALQARLEVDYREAGRYDLVLRAYTRGFLGKLVPWEGTFETHGWVTKDGYQPEQHKSTTLWQDEPDIKEYNYGRDGSFKSLRSTDEHVTDKLVEVDDELTQGTTDALTAALFVMDKIAADGECAGESEVFDGKRRFKQIFVHKDMPTLEATRYNIFEGTASECTVEVVPVAGEWHSKPRGWMSIQEQGRAKGTMPTVWFAKLGEDGPAVPIKIRVKTDYGTLFMHLAEYNNGKIVHVAEKREDDSF